jgi:hypothetical protein
VSDAQIIEMMKHLNILVFLVASFFCSDLMAQGSYFGVKGGLTVGTQQWNNYDRDPLFKYHGIVFIESLEETGQFAVFAQAGLHQKGSALRYQTGSFFGNDYRPPADEFIFNNISLTVGMKRKELLTEKSKFYYLFGLRGDYTVSTNLGDYDEDQFNRNFYPFEEFVRPWNFGLTVGGGLDFDISEFVGAFLEFTVNPDLSLQYRQPRIGNVPDPFRPGQNVTIGEREIRNITFEVTVGIRFLRQVIYVD